jgi:hypothetical protein
VSRLVELTPVWELGVRLGRPLVLVLVLVLTPGFSVAINVTLPLCIQRVPTHYIQWSLGKKDVTPYVDHQPAHETIGGQDPDSWSPGSQQLQTAGMVR